MNTIPFPTAPQPDRESRVRSLMEDLRTVLDERLRAMAEALVDTPPERILGDIQLTLRDDAHRLASGVLQVALDGDKKRGTSGRAESARTAEPMPDSSHTETAKS